MDQGSFPIFLAPPLMTLGMSHHRAHGKGRPQGWDGRQTSLQMENTQVTDVHVLVATISRDLAGELISAAVARSQGMVLVGNRVVGSLEIKDLLVKLPTSAACALVLVGPSSETRGVAARWLRLRERLVVVQVDTAADIVQITARDVGMEPLLTTLRELLDRGGPWATLPGGADGSRAHPLYIACTYNPQRPGLVTGRASSGPGH